jgi:CheY-like chemotaxis protein
MQFQTSTVFMSDLQVFSTARRVRTLVVDDFESMLTALSSCLELLDGVEVVGTALNGKEALEKVALLQPDLVIADLQMPVMDGFQLMRRLKQEYPEIRLVAVCGHASATIEREAIAAGAHAFVPKNTLPEGLLSKVQAMLPLQ